VLEEAARAEERAKSGFKATLKRIIKVKLDPERIAELTREVDNAYKRFTVSASSKDCQHLAHDVVAIYGHFDISQDGSCRE
jgi:hypothetical protein